MSTNNNPPVVTTADLPWAVFGRRAKPLALAASIANLSVAVGITENPFTNIPYLIVTALALAGLIAFWSGWWLNNGRLVQVGLILTVGLFAARAAYSGLAEGWLDHEVWLSFSWVLAAAGAFLLERRAPKTWDPETYGVVNE